MSQLKAKDNICKSLLVCFVVINGTNIKRFYINKNIFYNLISTIMVLNIRLCLNQLVISFY